MFAAHRGQTVRRTTDPGGVHQARVAAGRLRSALKSLEPLLDSEWSADLLAELRWLIDEPGAVRDGDIFRSKLQDVIARHPEIDHDAGRGVLQQVQLERRRDRAAR